MPKSVHRGWIAPLAASLLVANLGRPTPAIAYTYAIQPMSGPSDLGLSLGLPPKLDREEPEILKIYDKLLKECDKRGIYPGIHCSGPAGAARNIALGFKLVTLLNDSGIMATAAKQWIGETRKNSGGKA